MNQSTATKKWQVPALSGSVAAALMAMIIVAQVGCGSDHNRAGTSLAAGDTILVTGEAQCAQCRIISSDSVVIGQDSDSIALTSGIWVARRSDGHLFVTGAYGVVGVVEYDKSGQFLRVLGRQGSGPGEFAVTPTRPTFIHGDTLVVYDRRLQRFTKITPQGLLVAPVQMPFRPWGVSTAQDSSLLVSGVLPSIDPFEKALVAHLLKSDGTVVRSLGDSVDLSGGDRAAGFKQVAMSGRGTLAVANFYGYDITVHLTDGARKVISRRPDWFPLLNPDLSRHAQVVALWFDANDNLWVTSFVPVEATPTNERDELLTDTEMGDNVVEIFNPRSGDLVLSQRFDAPFAVSNGVSIRPTSGESGLVRWIISRPSLTSPNGEMK